MSRSSEQRQRYSDFIAFHDIAAHSLENVWRDIEVRIVRLLIESRQVYFLDAVVLFGHTADETGRH